MHASLPNLMSRSVTGVPHHLTAQELAEFLLEDITNTFVSAVLTPESQRLLLERVPEADNLERYLKMHGQSVRMPVTAVVADDKAQAVLVGLDSENEHPHITISVAEGIKPVYSNELFDTVDLQHITIFTVEGHIVVEALL